MTPSPKQRAANAALLRQLADLTPEEHDLLTAFGAPAREFLLQRIDPDGRLQAMMDEATKIGERAGAEDARRIIEAYRIK